MDQQQPDPVTLFYSYASEDKELRDELEKHLSVLQRQSIITGWYDGLIVPGMDRAQAVYEYLNKASIILLLVSSDFLASDYLYNEELQLALERSERREASVMVVILRPCDWEQATFGRLKCLPSDRKAVTTWSNQDEAFLNIEQGIRQAIEQRATSNHATSSSTRNNTSTPLPAETPSSTGDAIASPAETRSSTYRGHTHFVFTIAWSPDSKYIVSAGADETVRVWNATNLETIQTYSAHVGWFYPVVNPRPYVYTVAWSPNGKSIASAGTGEKLHVWNVSSGDTERIYHHPTKVFPSIHALAWSPDGKRIASICGSDVVNVSHKDVYIWDLESGREVLHYPMSAGLNGALTTGSALAWSPDGQYIASSCGDGTIHIWNPVTREQITTWHANAVLVLAIAWSPDSKQIAIATAGAKKNAVRVWDMARRETILTYEGDMYEGHTKDVRTVAWSPDGMRIASGGHDEVVDVWDATSGATISSRRHHSSWVTSVAWSPDGTHIASGSQDKTVRVWSLS